MNGTNNRTFRNFKKINQDALLSAANFFNWSAIYSHAIESQLAILYEGLNTLLNQFAPLKTVNTAKRKNDFEFSPVLRSAWNLKNYWMKVWRKFRSKSNKIQYISAHKRFERLLYSERLKHGIERFGPNVSNKQIFNNLKSSCITR
jgi:hypothetical protein